MSYRDHLRNLYSQLNENLIDIQYLFHQNQLLHLRKEVDNLVAGLCEEHSDVMGDLSDKMDVSSQAGLDPAMLELQRFLDEEITDACRSKMDELRNDIRYYLQMTASQKPPQSISYRNLGHIEAKHLYDLIVDPLSNQKRIEIMLAIQHGKKRFKELEERLNLQAGHLLYHLNPLKKGSYVDQDDKKNYQLTDKGKAMLHAISEIYEDFTN